MASVPSGSALGMLETVGLVAAIEAADAMLKAADVTLVRQQRVVPGLITHFVVGETAAVQAAVDAGLAAAERIGRVAGSHVIPRPDPDVWRRIVGIEIEGDTPPAPAKTVPAKAAPSKPAKAAPPKKPTGKPAGTPAETKAAAATPASDAPDYAAMTVRALRALARDRDDAGLQGRAVASASKDELVAALRAADGSPAAEAGA